MFCGECGARNPDTNQFCRNCGKPLARHQPPVPAAAGQVPPATPSASAPVLQPAPVPVVPYQPPAGTAPAAPAPAAAPKRRWNWLGIVSLLIGILSWGILTVLLAILAVVLGIISLVWFRKMTGRIGISAILGIVIAIGSLASLVLLA
jgi:predicted lipid-binding transport protein (Tim44 family)